MVNELKDAPSETRSLGFNYLNKTSSEFSLSTITEHPLDQSSITSDYPSDDLTSSPTQSYDPHDSNGITSLPPFYTKRPIRKLSKISRPNFFS